jgi:hypothetical protein
MAESCRLGVTRFVHCFREQTNLTPVKYLNLARIRKACDLLAGQPGIPITDIAFPKSARKRGTLKNRRRNFSPVSDFCRSARPFPNFLPAAPVFLRWRADQNRDFTKKRGRRARHCLR